ncbi:TPA: molybdopterin cofactor-binding domain-containing protein [Clostridium botulinum]|uniref:molybdopterin cofactor-binding domain-containing protein n=1 Tax=Clostridium botulinum TaxID=1491 RepID=UPI0027E06646|nr:molybdopterin cofactor-binding domain-containing protein [Clostridium botulinum]
MRRILITGKQPQVRTTLLIGRSALRVAEDAINQLCDIAAVVLGCSPVELNVGRGRVFLRGNPGPEWTVGAAAVEVELDKKEYTCKIIKAACVVDAGKVINAGTARGKISGGMNLGLSFASREAFLFTNKGIIQNKQLRTYSIMRLGQNPEYLVDFVETPHLDGPYGARGIGEYGVIGMPEALANSLSCAVEAPLNQLPLIPEFIWKVKERGH